MHMVNLLVIGLASYFDSSVFMHFFQLVFDFVFPKYLILMRGYSMKHMYSISRLAILIGLFLYVICKESDHLLKYLFLFIRNQLDSQRKETDRLQQALYGSDFSSFKPVSHHSGLPSSPSKTGFSTLPSTELFSQTARRPVYDYNPP